MCCFSYKPPFLQLPEMQCLSYGSFSLEWMLCVEMKLPKEFLNPEVDDSSEFADDQASTSTLAQTCKELMRFTEY